MLRVLLALPALTCAECEGDSCPAQGSALLQASKAVVQKAGPAQEEPDPVPEAAATAAEDDADEAAEDDADEAMWSDEAAFDDQAEEGTEEAATDAPEAEAAALLEKAGLKQEHAQEFLAKLAQLQKDSERHEADSEDEDDSGAEYVICHSTGVASGQSCQYWPNMGHIPAGTIAGWNGTHYCQQQKESDHTCQAKCMKTTGSCDEGGAIYESCRCEDLTAKTVAACEGKASGDKCTFNSETFTTVCPSVMPDAECKTAYRYSSMCQERDGSQSCLPLRQHAGSDCRTGYGKSLKWKPLGSPCVHSTFTSSGRRRYTFRQNTPTLSYCVPGTSKYPMICTSGFHNKLSDELKAAMTVSDLPAKMTEAASKMSESEVADVLSFWGEA